MHFWNNIIHTALLGTDKKQLTQAELTPALSSVAEQMAIQQTSREEQFLQIAAVAFNYRQAGVTAVKNQPVTISKAEKEEKEYCSPPAMLVLKDILTEESLPLLKYWLQLCRQKKKLIAPDLLPAILQTGVTQKSLQPYITDCAGKRGEWLSRFNADWKFSSGSGPEETWQTGTAEQRRQVIQQLRKQEPAKALEWIQQTWPQEDANTKSDLLRTLAVNVSANDVDFLESLSSEKGKKVKEEALSLLKKIPSSSIVQQYWNIVKASVVVRKEKALLGLMSKTSLFVKNVLPPDDNLFKTGIEKLSSDKKISDEEFIVYQLMQSVPLSYYENEWQMKPADIIDLFQKDETGKKLLPALIISTVNFTDERWAAFFMQYCITFYTDIIPLLPPQQQEFYSNKFFGEQPDNIIHYAAKREQEWSIELALAIFKHVAKNLYHYNRSFFNQHIHLIPPAISTELEKCTPSEEGYRTMWNNTSGYILKLLSLKTQTIKAFNV